MLMQHKKLPDFTIIGARSMTNKNYEIPTHSLIAGNPAKLIKTGIWRDFNDDKIII